VNADTLILKSLHKKHYPFLEQKWELVETSINVLQCEYQ